VLLDFIGDFLKEGTTLFIKAEDTKDQGRKAGQLCCGNGLIKAFLAKSYNMTQANLYNWLKKNKIDETPIVKIWLKD